MPVTWVDGVTPVNATNMEILDTDIAARQVLSEKGVANGYAPLDSGARVPLANLPPVSGVDFIGTWGAGTAYKRGDVVSYNGNDYMAVNDSTGVTPPAPGTPMIVRASYGTTLPTAPFDGQEAILVDVLTNPSYQWHFRYNAGSSSAYKWEFIGGAKPSTVLSVDQPMGAANTWTNISPSLISLPRSGEYALSAFSTVLLPSSSLGSPYLAIYANTTANITAFAQTTAAASSYGSLAIIDYKAALVAGNGLGLAGFGPASTIYKAGATLSVIPVRVA